ncbi:MAG: trypsin-like peptidase domain-containing protein [Bdellovibrionales bacterium]|nr:trypsin-like peptidase domain-containing protein [Bdellovibrionales bacterium]
MFATTTFAIQITYQSDEVEVSSFASVYQRVSGGAVKVFNSGLKAQLGASVKYTYGHQLSSPDGTPLFGQGKSPDEATQNVLRQLMSALENNKSSGSGFFIAENQNGHDYLLTNAHVVDGADWVGILPSFVRGSVEPIRAQVIWQSSNSMVDLAILKLSGDAKAQVDAIYERYPGKEKYIFPFAEVDLSGDYSGKSIATVSNPLGSPAHLTQGSVEQVSNDILDRPQLADLKAAKGSSGSPVFDNRGTLVGIIFAVYNPQSSATGQSNSTVFLPASVIKKVLLRQPLPLPSHALVSLPVQFMTDLDAATYRYLQSLYPDKYTQAFADVQNLPASLVTEDWYFPEIGADLKAGDIVLAVDGQPTYIKDFSQSSKVRVVETAEGLQAFTNYLMFKSDTRIEFTVIDAETRSEKTVTINYGEAQLNYNAELSAITDTSRFDPYYAVGPVIFSDLNISSFAVRGPTALRTYAIGRIPYGVEIRAFDPSRGSESQRASSYIGGTHRVFGSSLMGRMQNSPSALSREQVDILRQGGRSDLLGSGFVVVTALDGEATPDLETFKQLIAQKRELGIQVVRVTLETYLSDFVGSETGFYLDIGVEESSDTDVLNSIFD